MSAEPDSPASHEPNNEPRHLEPVARRPPRLWYPNQLTPRDDLTLFHNPQNPRSEAIRALRTRLLLARDDSLERGTVAILSPGPAEGRSRLCAELAIAFAQLGRPTLLIDADLRHPRQHILFGDSNPWGLMQTLRYTEPPRMHGVEEVPELALLTSGGLPTNPLELLSGERFEQLIVAWQREFEFVVIDTPPVTRYSDGLVIAAAARRALVVTRATATSFNDMKEMTRQLAAVSMCVVGAVINNF